MTLHQDLRRRKGIARSAELHALGHSEHTIRSVLAHGGLRRLRRGWVALPGADPALVFAAEHGVVLSCVTQAERLGLWGFAVSGRHVAAPHPGSRSDPCDARVHWNRPPIARRRSLLEDPVENVLSLVATCQPQEQALVLVESALNRRLTARRTLEAMPIPSRLRRLLEVCTPYADSGLETLFRTRLSFLRTSIRSQVWILGHRVDLLIGDCLVIQLDGATHAGAQRDADNLHDARLKLEGYHVLRFGYTQVMHHWETVHDVIVAAVAQGLHLRKDRIRGDE